MTPIHSLLSIGGALAPDYFSPGVSIMHDKVVCSLWAIAYYAGNKYRYERTGLEAPWIRVS